MLGKCAGGTRVSLYQDLYLTRIHESKWKITKENNEEKFLFRPMNSFIPDYLMTVKRSNHTGKFSPFNIYLMTTHRASFSANIYNREKISFNF